MISGPANCGKTCMLKLVRDIFNCFVSPATGTFAWVSAENKEVLFLNELRWTGKLMPCGDFLNLEEGLPLHLPAPKTYFAEDILWTRKTPIYATSIDQIIKLENNKLDVGETNMMKKRSNYFEFYKPVKNPKETPSCPTCFANLMLN